MKKKTILLGILMISVNIPIIAEHLPIKMGESAKQVILNKYDTNYSFHDGLLAVKNGETGRWGFIDEAGNKVIDYQWEYETFKYPQFGGGACLVCKYSRDTYGILESTWYIIDKSGNAIKLKEQILESTPFNKDGYAIVVKRMGATYSKCTYINAKGQEVFPEISQTVMTIAPECPNVARPFSNGLAAFYDIDERRYGFINKKGVVVCPPVFIDVQDYSEGLAAVQVPDNGKKWGFIDVTGKMVIPAKFSNEPYPFREGKASVEKRDGTVVMIDKTGTVISPEFSDIRNFHLGYAFAQTKGKSFLDIVDENFNVVREQVTGFRLDSNKRNGKDPIEFINGYYSWEGNPGFSPSYLLSPIGKHLKFKSGFGDLIDVKCRTEKIIHVQSRKFDGFIDYEGNVVFYFAEEEF